ncbi:hypothetical protein SAMN05421504_1011508 [Amycolatopsis xylanica]|uniref:STAS domain-containing protein n=1 Tax=Amycolatopsis xylanica TaxID=589385 RepID=A0A1H2WE29_9PSEU|nr:ATP-binding protein [Amycolatopsis xylanica]SDW78850.1 hypothetical protein SAMN05421504_1011508 [Amycolatopsis xylanica]
MTANGSLDLAGYAALRDGLLKIAADGPRGLIIDITGLSINEASPATVFPFVAARIRDWPGIPLTLVTQHPGHTRLLHASTIDRYVSVHPDVESAEHALPHPIHRQARQVIPRTHYATAFARSYVRQHLAEWSAPEFIDDATVIASELVENAIRHTTSAPELRLALRRGMLTIAAADDDPRHAELIGQREPGGPGLGLQIVADAARTWGSNSRWSGGKVVWAVLRKPT